MERRERIVESVMGRREESIIGVGEVLRGASQNWRVDSWERTRSLEYLVSLVNSFLSVCE